DLLDVGGDIGLGPDLIEHAQHFFVRAPVQGSRKSGGGGGGGQVGVGLGTAHGAHGVGAAVLFVIGVQNKEDVEGAGNHRIGYILGLDHLPQHVHEVFGISEIIVRIDVGESDTMAIGHGRDGRHLADQALDLE